MFQLKSWKVIVACIVCVGLCSGCVVVSQSQAELVSLTANEKTATINSLCETGKKSGFEIYSFWYQSEHGPSEVFYRCLTTRAEAMRDREHLRGATIVTKDSSVIDVFGELSF